MGKGGEGIVAGWPFEAEVVGEVVGAAWVVAGLDSMVAGEAAGEKC